MIRLLTSALAATLLLATVAQAQTAPPARLRGKIDAISADAMELTLRNGSKAQVKLPGDIRVTYLTVAQPSDIKEGSYIGTVSVPNPDGTWKALEVQVFPPSMRGLGEGSREWDLVPQSTMTNGTIGSLVASNGRTIVVTYKGGEKRVNVPDDVPFVSYEPADRAALTMGANVIVNGTRATDGVVTAGSINVGKAGLVPPM